jgi:hypothetical protein
MFAQSAMWCWHPKKSTNQRILGMFDNESKMICFLQNQI